MVRATQWKWAGMLTLGAILFALAGNSAAQPKKPNEKHDATALNSTLREVINAGAKLYNVEGDHAGCYRLYQGSLLTIRPFVAPDMQKTIDAGLAGAEKMGTFADRAFELRRVLDDLRAKTNVGDEKKDDKMEKGKDEKKKKKDEKSSQQDDDKGQVAGKLTFDGKPVAGGYFVTLISAKGKTISTTINKDGSFKFTMPIAVGDYRVAIEMIPDEKLKVAPLPARYRSGDTSGVAILVVAGKQDVIVRLNK